MSNNGSDHKTWEEVDPHIFANRKLQGMLVLVRLCNCSLTAAMDIYVQRYKALREQHPQKFVKGHDEYWDGYC